MGVKHMQHPYELPQVDTGNDLKTVFKEAAEFLSRKPGSVKIDGVSVPIKLIDSEREFGKEFASDRGSANPLDVQGITVDNVRQRWEEGHGLIDTTIKTLNIFQKALPSITKELKILGMYNSPSMYLNMDHVGEGKTNIVGYEGAANNFLAIHDLNQWYRKDTDREGKMSRPGLERPIIGDRETKEPSTDLDLTSEQKDAMKRLIAKLDKTAKEIHGKDEKGRDNFAVMGLVPTKLRKDIKIDIDNALKQKLTIVSEEGKPGITRALKDWLEKAENPRGRSIKLATGKRVDAFDKKMYVAIAKGIPLDQIIATESMNAQEYVKLAVDAAIFWETTRVLGNSILDALTSQMGSVKEHEGVVIQDKNLWAGQRIKITGDFLIKVLRSPFQKQPEETPGEVPEEEPEQERDGSQLAGLKTIALFPGGFKPPHKGHLSAIGGLSALDKIFIIMRQDPEESNVKRVINDKPIDVAVAKQIWQIYLEDAGVSNYDFVIIASDEKFEYIDKKTGEVAGMAMTPYNKVVDIIKKYSIPGQTFLLLTSTKDAGRFVPVIRTMQERGEIPEGVSIQTRESEASTADTGERLNASTLRRFIESGNYTEFLNFIPDSTKQREGRADQIWALLGGKKKVSEQIISIVESLLDESEQFTEDFQKNMKRRLKKSHKFYLDTGPQSPGSAFPSKRPTTNSNAFLAKEIEDVEKNEEQEVLEEYEIVTDLKGVTDYAKELDNNTFRVVQQFYYLGRYLNDPAENIDETKAINLAKELLKGIGLDWPTLSKEDLIASIDHEEFIALSKQEPIGAGASPGSTFAINKYTLPSPFDEDELEEMSMAVGSVEGGAGNAWPKRDIDTKNKKQKRKSKKVAKESKNGEFIDEVLNYLLDKTGALVNDN